MRLRPKHGMEFSLERGKRLSRKEAPVGFWPKRQAEMNFKEKREAFDNATADELDEKCTATLRERGGHL